jgi:ornithine carbamoyltransferase
MSANKVKDLVSIADFSKNQIHDLIKTTYEFKASPNGFKPLQGMTLAMIFQKPSTRTTVSFAVGTTQLGGHPLVLNSQDLQMKRGETLVDTAKTLSVFVNGIMIRANRHEDVLELAKHASIPVINGLTDKEHPCQVLADIFTILEQKKLKSPEGLKKMKLCYLGDGNNVAQSLMLAAAILGMEMVVASPKGYEPETEYMKKAQMLAKESGARISVNADPLAAVEKADIIYTDVWTSMGKEEEREQRKSIFMSYQVNEPLLAFAKPDVMVMHCLPAHRDEEITEEVIDGRHSIVFPQAENRLHMQKAILADLLGK